MSADSSSNSMRNSQQKLASGTSERGARAADQLLREAARNKKPEQGGPSGQSRRPFNRDRDPNPSGKELRLDDAAEMLGFDMGDKQSKSARADRSKRSAGRDQGENEGAGSGRRVQDDDAQQRAARPALELDDDEFSDGESRKKVAKSKTISDFAAEMELDAKQVYDLAVAFDDDSEPMTIGAMKDRIKEFRDFDLRRDEFEDYRTDSMNEVIAARQQIDGVMQRIAQAIPAETLQHHFSDYIQSHQQRVAEARKQVREYFPEWSDAAVMQKDREALDSHLETYGFTKFEVDNLQDARLVRFAVHAMRLKQRYDRMKAELAKHRDKVPTKAPTSRRPSRENPTANAQKLADAGDKIGAVASLIR